MLQCATMATSFYETFVWTSKGEAETIAFGRLLGAHLAAGDVLLLLGSFGMGKTHLTKGIAAGLGADPNDVNSPSFVLINEYEADATHRRIPIYHVDLYRIETPEALSTVGLEGCLDGDGVCIIEWAERATDWLPPDQIVVEFTELGPTTRRLLVTGQGERSQAVVARLRDDIARVGNIEPQTSVT